LSPQQNFEDTSPRASGDVTAPQLALMGPPTRRTTVDDSHQNFYPTDYIRVTYDPAPPMCTTPTAGSRAPTSHEHVVNPQPDLNQAAVRLVYKPVMPDLGAPVHQSHYWASFPPASIPAPIPIHPKVSLPSCSTLAGIADGGAGLKLPGLKSLFGV
ncbi:hypothetical protein HDU93_009611, partial [Gonapodya sp. JEL0774]